MLKTICLNMIVKNESKVIRRCLESIIDYIDYWVIVDTGSTDGTQKVIQEVLKDVPGDLYERPWVDFAHNRNEALYLAKGKGDYILFIDADDQMIFSKHFQRPFLDADCYLVSYHKKTCNTHRILLINTKLSWNWSGVVHEALETLDDKKVAIFPDAYQEAGDDGFRSQDPEKHEKDVRMLEEVVEKNPNDSRAFFHLGVFCEEAFNYTLALKYYTKRAAMGGWDQEVYYSLFRIGGLQEKLEMNPELFLESYQKAYDYRPSRAEPLFYMARYYLKMGDYNKAYELTRKCLDIPLSQDSIYVIRAVYDYWALCLYADCAFYLGKHSEALEAYRILLKNPDLPPETRILVEKNRANLLSRRESGKSPTLFPKFKRL
ncbi:MAG: glycosyltransferase [Verrucomicrobia bacterium]|nr:glycosyltransferase [Verrucomicrobiota bacterium]